MKRSAELISVAALFTLLEIIFWYPALLPGQTLFLRDLTLDTVPLRTFWAASGGYALWNPYGFFGMPFGANPQCQPFYPFNFFYLFLGAERGLVFFIIFHQLVFNFTLYLALRELGLQWGSSLFAAIGLGFGGFLCSSTLLILILSTVAWFPLLIFFLSRGARQNWLRAGLWIGVLVALQILAGEIEMAAMSWVLAVLAAGSGPEGRPGRGFSRMLGALAVGLVFGLALCLFQLALTLPLLPLSNRAAGFALGEALTWSLRPFQLKSLFVPNYLFPVSAGAYWGLGLFNEFPFFLSLYLGAMVGLAAVFALAGRKRWQAGLWLFTGLLAVLIAMGDDLPLYGLLHQFLPGFKAMRFPMKFLFMSSFSLCMLAALGLDQLRLKPRPITGLVLLLAAAGLGLYMIAFPITLSGLGVHLNLIPDRLLLRSGMRVSAFLLLGGGLILLLAEKRKRSLGILLAAACFADLFLAHHHLNPAVPSSFYRPNAFVRELQKRPRDEKYPPRVLSLAEGEQDRYLSRLTDPVSHYRRQLNSLADFSSVRYGLDDLRAYGSLHVSDITVFEDLLERGNSSSRKLILARAGVEYLYRGQFGFSPVAAPFPRASVFYQARMFKDRDEILRLWSHPGFNAQDTVLLEGSGLTEASSGNGGSEPAKIVAYENEKVVIKAAAKQAGWLVLLDSFYPGWRAYVDGREERIFRADGFFRAVSVPAGEHTVEFRYLPKSFIYGMIGSGFGLLAWSLALIISLQKWKR